MSAEALFLKKLNQLFGNYNDELKKIIFKSGYLDSFLDLSDSIKFDEIIEFIIQHEESIISNTLVDELFKNILLKKDGIIYRTEVEKINHDYLKHILYDIKNKNFYYESIIYFLYIIKIINIYGLDCHEEKIEIILNNGIFSTIENLCFVSDGDTYLPKPELLNKTDKLIKWCKIVGNNIKDYIFALELLQKRLEGLYFSDRLEIEPYKEQLLSLISTCKLAISVRDGDIMPTAKQIEDINNIFNNYEEINKSLIFNSVNNNQFSILHFIQSDEVCYKIVDGKIININETTSTEENKFNKGQNDFFIENYISKIKKIIEIDTNEVFDMNNEEHKKKLEYYLNIYNTKFNNGPLFRLPLDACEMGDDFETYIRKSDNRLSCSFCDCNYSVRSHLGRSVALMIKPLSFDSILTTSIGYTFNKDFYDFNKDSVSYLQLIEQIYNSVKTNETVLDVSKIEVIGIALISDDQTSIDRANKLSQVYNVPIFKINNTELKSHRKNI